MKQVELAQQLGISKSYLSMILSGKRMASPEIMREISSLEVHNFEPSSSLRGRCPKPLDECATYQTEVKSSQIRYLTSLSYPIHKGQASALLKPITAPWMALPAILLTVDGINSLKVYKTLYSLHSV